ncbi:hypothetical protein DPMN_084884 [Dreissena polymorpha]|uniref:Uncharacterized protein n=1 Tax=Dreissena polymorpha TaxID=45954 RepID=A0A9D3YFQ6_DREPO|nr:hypothetical protein DPMN_084884 [Dreissena polymorpha]
MNVEHEGWGLWVAMSIGYVCGALGLGLWMEHIGGVCEWLMRWMDHVDGICGWSIWCMWAWSMQCMWAVYLARACEWSMQVGMWVEHVSWIYGRSMSVRYALLQGLPSLPPNSISGGTTWHIHDTVPIAEFGIYHCTEAFHKLCRLLHC